MGFLTAGSLFSPLTYLVDPFYVALTGSSVFAPVIDCAALIVERVLFILLAGTANIPKSGHTLSNFIGI